MGFEIADLRGVGADFSGQMVVYLASGDNPITEDAWASYAPDPGFILNTPREGKFDVLDVLGSPYQPTGSYTYYTDASGYTWQAVAAVENRIWPFDPDDYAGYTPPLTSAAAAGFLVATPLPGTIQYNGNDKNHLNIYYADDAEGNPQVQYFVTDPWGNVYILKSVNAANDTPEEVAAAVEAAILPQGWTKSSGYLDVDTAYGPVWSGDVAHANEFRDSADSAWMQISWGQSGKTLAQVIGDGLDIWGGNTDDLVKGNAENNVIHGGDGDDRVLGWKGKDLITGDAGNDRLHGGKGADILIGGAGNDKLKGGKGADTFLFESLDIGKDKILDFGRGKDVIDLSGIDADVGTLGDDAFTFIGHAKFSGEAGELRYGIRPDEVRIRGDVDGDGKADFVIRVADVHQLHAHDFVL